MKAIVYIIVLVLLLGSGGCQEEELLQNEQEQLELYPVPPDTIVNYYIDSSLYLPYSHQVVYPMHLHAGKKEWPFYKMILITN